MSQDNTQVRPGGSPDERSAGDGGAGAPPDPHESNKAPDDLTRVYTKAGIRVEWHAVRCIHSAACIRAQPGVFDPHRRPWVNLEGASEEEIADAVMRCPTGALQYERLDGTPIDTRPGDVTIEAIKNGPYFVRGAVQVTDGNGNVIRKDTRVALCRCGQSRHMPFCDNTHREIGFRSEGL